MGVRETLVPLLAGTVVLCLAGCGRTESPAAVDPARVGGSAAAKVNGEVISFEEARDLHGLRSAQDLDPQAVDKLVDLTLLAQAARAQGLEKDPEIARRLEASAREVLARAYLDRVADAKISAPSAVEAREYYDAHPELFSARRIYQVREVRTAWPAAGGEDLKKALQATRGAAEVSRKLKASGLRFTERELREPAERLPLLAIKQIAQLAPGQSVVLVDAESAEGRPGRARVLTVLGSQPAPRLRAEAMPAIEAFLLNEKRRLAGRERLAELRASAQIIKYAGDSSTDAANEPKPAVR